MSTAIILLVCLLFCASIGVGIYFLKPDLFSQPQPYLGLSYKKTSPRSSAVLSKLQQVMKTLQDSTCKFVKPAWSNMKPTLIASGAAVTAVQNTSCAAQTKAITQMMQNAQVENATTKIPLSQAELNTIRSAIVDVLTEVLKQTCVNDKLDIASAIGLMDETIAAFCP